jgi:hypothetical protein
MAILKKFAVVVASAVATVALSGACVGAASASTPTYRYLCTENPFPNFCATAHGQSQTVQMEGNTEPPHNDTNWYYPHGSAFTEIQQANTDLCMQVDHDADNHVIEATCNGASYQEWDLVGHSQFRSEWNEGVCLTTPDLGGDLYVGGCSTTGSWTQTFHGLT